MNRININGDTLIFFPRIKKFNKKKLLFFENGWGGVQEVHANLMYKTVLLFIRTRKYITHIHCLSRAQTRFIYLF